MTDLRPGDPESIAGYRLLSRLGSGGQGVVFLAAASSGDLVAIKRLLPGPEDARARAQFAKEVAAARLVAPFCTAQVVDAQLDGDSPYVVSEFIAGPSLQQQIEHDGPLRGTTLQRMAIGTATALAAIHQAGVVHRDFKPANVMLSPEGPRVIDFGIARDLSTDTTVTSRVFGTPAYMSPEQLRAEPVGPATDMFAWASVIAYAATGRAPFDAPHVMAVVHRIGSGEPELSGVPDELAAVLRQCLEKDPALRPSAQQALAQLLGRPAPQRDQTDPTTVLAEAAGLVRPVPPPHPAAPTVAAPTVPAPTAPVSAPQPLEQPSSGESELPAWGSASAAPAVPAGSALPSWGDASRPAADPARRRRKRPLLSAALVLAIVLGGVAAYSLSRRQAASDTGTDLAASDAAADADEIAEAQGRATAPDGTDDEGADLGEPTDDDLGIPAGFGGTWKGRIVQSGTAKGFSTVRLTLRAGEPSGRLRLTELGCSGTVEVAAVLPQVVSLEAVMTQDPKRHCSKHSKVWLTGLNGERLKFSIVDDGKPQRAGTGTLRR